MKNARKQPLIFRALLGIAILFASLSPLQSTAQNPTTDKVVKVLAIGNSFSDDAIENYFYDLAKAGGYRVIIGNMYIGGAPLDLHWRNAQKDSAAYSYRKINVDGKRKTSPKTSIATALADEDWDYISFQQASPKSGLLDTYREPLSGLFAYVKARASNPKVKFLWHQTWAYAQNSTHSGFANYHHQQLEMYKAIMQASKQVKNIVPIDLVVPAGTAIQNARSKLGDVLNRDGYHLDLGIGRYTAACTWYAAIFERKAAENSFYPPNVGAEQAKIAQLAADAAIRKPYKITVIK